MKINRREDVFVIMSSIFGMRWSDDFRGAVWLEKGAPVIGIAFNNFVGKTCKAFVVVRKPEALKREIIREAFEFPFVVCGMEWILVDIAVGNSKAIAGAQRLGFKGISVLQGGASTGEDIIVMGMQKQDCRWI